MATKNLFIDGITARDPAYEAIRDSDHSDDKNGKQLCLELWEVFEQFADDHFIDQIQIDFDARFWEMYLTCTLYEREYPVSCPKPGPDILLSYENTNIWIEAIAPSSGNEDSPDSVPELEMGIVQDVPNDQVILRYTAAISEKFNKYKGYIEKGILKDVDPFVVAINGCRVRSARTDFEPPRIVRSVFPIGHEYVTIDTATGSAVDNGFHFRKTIPKTSGTEIPIDIFLDERYSYISGVMFSVSDCCNRPKKNGDDFIFVHNPLANNPIQHELLRIGREYIAEPTEGDKYILRFNDWKNV